MEEPSEVLNRMRKRTKFRKFPVSMKNVKRGFSQTCTSAFLAPRGVLGNFLAGIIGLSYGVFLSICFYFLILKDLEFSNKTNFWLTVILGSLLGFGCALSSQLRCITLLTIPAMCGRGGRGTFKAFLVAYLLAGPVANLTKNGKEIVRSFTCTSTMIYQINKLKNDLIYRPLYNALMHVKGDMNDVQDAMDSLNAVVAPLTHEFRDQDESLYEENDYIDTLQTDIRRSIQFDQNYFIRSKRNREDIVSQRQVEVEYYKKLGNRCENIISGANANCKKAFAHSYDDCANAVTAAAAWALCWPMKLTFICNTVSVFGGEDICDPKKEIASGWGHGYEYLLKAKKEMFGDFQKARITYKIKEPNLDLRTAEDTAQAIMKEFDQKKDFIDMILLLIKRLMALAFIRVVFSATSYHTDYLKNINFSNFYITKYFKKIDARRYSQEKHTLLPLKKTEKLSFVDPFQFKLAKKELRQTLGNCIKIFIEMLTATTIILIDRLFYETLDLVSRHSKIDFQQSGSHNMNVTVNGTGMIASMVRSVVNSFNFQKQLNHSYSNSECLPNPSLLKASHLERIYIMYIVLFTMAICEGYAERLKRFFCAVFYPRREKQRVLFLYNDTLKKRKAYFKYKLSKVKKNIEDNKLSQDVSIPLILRLKYPKFFGWLIIFNCAKRKCLICGELEPKNPKQREQAIYECATCLYIFCLECWVDIDQKCIVCFPRPVTDDESGEEELDQDEIID